MGHHHGHGVLLHGGGFTTTKVELVSRVAKRKNMVRGCGHDPPTRVWEIVRSVCIVEVGCVMDKVVSRGGSKVWGLICLWCYVISEDVIITDHRRLQLLP